MRARGWVGASLLIAMQCGWQSCVGAGLMGFPSSEPGLSAPPYRTSLTTECQPTQIISGPHSAYSLSTVPQAVVSQVTMTLCNSQSYLGGTKGLLWGPCGATFTSQGFCVLGAVGSNENTCEETEAEGLSGTDRVNSKGLPTEPPCTWALR